MKKIYKRIRELAFPYQDKRNDKGHASITLKYALKLLALEGGDEDIVIPAIILHDTGWSQVRPDYVNAVFKGKTGFEQAFPVIIQHQNESVRLAADLLHRTGYPAPETREILEIILQHDTRRGFISKNEGLVRDADKLYRFSRIGFKNDIRRSGVTAKQECERLEKEINNPGYLYSDSARRIAAEELAMRKKGLK